MSNKKDLEQIGKEVEAEAAGLLSLAQMLMKSRTFQMIGVGIAGVVGEISSGTMSLASDISLLLVVLAFGYVGYRHFLRKMEKSKD